jgi:hypothetical protein
VPPEQKVKIFINKINIKKYKICKIQSTKGDFVILLDMFVYVLKLPYRFLMYVLGGLYGYKNKKIDHLKAHHYLCRNCQTANIFQPWVLRKERLVRCPHCRELNKLPYGTNPKEAFWAVVTMGLIGFLPFLIWKWLTSVNSAWL